MACVLLCKGKKDFRLTYVCGQFNACVRMKRDGKVSPTFCFIKTRLLVVTPNLNFDRICASYILCVCVVLKNVVLVC